eukprot:g5092.t1
MIEIAATSLPCHHSRAQLRGRLAHSTASSSALIERDRTRSRSSKERRAAKNERWGKADECAAERARQYGMSSGAGSWKSKPRWKQERGQRHGARRRGRQTGASWSPASGAQAASPVTLRAPRSTSSKESRAAAAWGWRRDYERDLQSARVQRKLGRHGYHPQAGASAKATREAYRQLCAGLEAEEALAHEKLRDKERVRERAAKHADNHGLPMPHVMRGTARLRAKRQRRERREERQRRIDKARHAPHTRGPCLACLLAALLGTSASHSGLGGGGYEQEQDQDRVHQITNSDEDVSSHGSDGEGGEHWQRGIGVDKG